MVASRKGESDMPFDSKIDAIGQAAVDLSSLSGVTHADCRVSRIIEEEVRVRDGAVEALSKSESYGMGVRVLANGAWGFASEAEVTPQTAVVLRDRAIEIARASARLIGEQVELAPVKAVQGAYRTKIINDPFKIPLKEKLQYAIHLDSLIRAISGITRSSAGMTFSRELRYFYSSEGSRISQEIIHTGGGITVGVSRGPRDFVERSFPTSGGQHEAAGYELIDNLKLAAAIPQLAEEAKALIDAQPCPSKTTTVILSGDLVSLQVHESVGHPLELDRVYGSERNFSGTSFATPDQLGKLKYASEIVTVHADPSAEGGLGSFGFDDEGVPAGKSTLIDKGMLTGYLTSRETAAKLGTTSNGSMRAWSWAFLPLIRMTNIIFAPGDKTLAQMISETDDGIFIQTPTAWSIDDRREKFQLGGEIGWVIKGGKLAEMVKSPVYVGETVAFWNSCNAIGTPAEHRLWGTPSCSKGQPAQTIGTAQGAAPARFANVKIGR